MKTRFIFILAMLAFGSLMARELCVSPYARHNKELQDTTKRKSADTLKTKLSDSLKAELTDSLKPRLMDSTDLEEVDTLDHPQDSLSEKELLKLAKKAAKDSAKAIRDSIRNAPRMMNTYYFEDSLQYKRIIVWQHDQYLNKHSMSTLDTLANSTIHDYAFLKDDVGATYLGVAGSATLYHNYFKRKTLERFDAYNPYLSETYTPETLPFYNTKSPYTELMYAGTLFANKQKEEANIKVLHTQNLSPELNISVQYKRQGGRGMLVNEATESRSFTAGANYVGQRYIMHAGYIFNKITRKDNGGIADDSKLLDTVIDVRTIPTYLQNANTDLRSNTFFITHTYGIPIRIFKGDTLRAGEGTTMYFGHSGTYATYKRTYHDQIEMSDSIGRDFYHQNFYYHPTTTYDSLRTMKLDNRFFVRLQPWAKSAIVSKLDGGVGYQMLSNYAFNPEYYLGGTQNQKQNNLYFYAGAAGSFRQYFEWNALGRTELAGYYQGDFSLQAGLRASAYPLTGGIHLTGKFSMESRTPDWHTHYFFGNHHRWDQNFNKITETRIQGALSIPHWKMEAAVGYSMIGNHIYYDTLGLPQQAAPIVNVLSASLTKNFKLWLLHFDHRLLFQLSSNQDVIPLPTFSGNIRYYLEASLVKNVLTAQLGADLTYYTEYYAPAYDPDTGNFRAQNEHKIGNNPYIDVFVNLTWKRATIFVKYVNAAEGWPQSNYFSALHYIRPQTAIKFGMTWPFYLK